MLAIVNPRSGGGRGEERWRRIEGDLRRALGSLETATLVTRTGLDRRIAHALADGETRFLAAGGDGTVNAVVDALVRLAPSSLREDVTLGAVGLGSSNDFHKPVRTRVGGRPCRIEFASATPHDVGLLRATDAGGTLRIRHWILNASVGTTADANRFFNEPDTVLGWLKRTSTSLGITYAALRALLTVPPRDITLRLEENFCRRGPTRNLGFSLLYDSPFEPDSGRFFVHHLEGVSLLRLLHAFVRLSRGRWRGTPGASSWRATAASVFNGGAPFAVEFDGEVMLVREASFRLLPRKLRICP